MNESRYLRVAAGVPRVYIADTKANASAIANLIGECSEKGVNLLVTPELGITAYTCYGSLRGTAPMRRKALQLCRSGLRRRDKRSRAKDPSAVIQRILRTAMVRGGNRHPCLLPFDNYLRQRIPVRHRPLVLGRRSRRERGDMRRPVGTRVSGMPRRQVRGSRYAQSLGKP